MKQEFIQDSTLLIPSFYYGIKTDDIEFARFIASKINVKDKDAVLRFVTTKLPNARCEINDQSLLHFAANSSFSDFMEILFNLLENAGCDLDKLLLDKEIITNNRNEKK